MYRKRVRDTHLKQLTDTFWHPGRRDPDLFFRASIATVQNLEFHGPFFLECTLPLLSVYMPLTQGSKCVIHT